MASPEQDALQQYHNLVAARGALDVVQYADETVAALYAEVASGLDRQISEAAGPLTDTVLADGTTAATAIEQLDRLTALADPDLREKIAAARESYVGRARRAAEFLLHQEDLDDPRRGRILSAAGMLSAEAAAAEAPEEVVPVVDAAVLAEATEPSAADAAAQAEPITPEQSLTSVDPDDVRVRLEAYVREMTPGSVQELSPAQLWGIAAPGVSYASSIRHRHILRAAVAALAEGLSARHNDMSGRAARYILENLIVHADSDDAKSGVPDPAAPPASAEAGGKFDIDLYFSVDDALILATFLTRFNGYLEQNDIPPLSTDTLMPLLAAAGTTEETARTEKEIRRARTETLAKIGALFQNEALLAQAVDTLDQEDPRYALFDYLFTVINEKTYPKLNALLQLNKKLLIAMRLEREGGDNVVKVDGVVMTVHGHVVGQTEITGGHIAGELTASAAPVAEQRGSAKLPAREGDAEPAAEAPPAKRAAAPKDREARPPRQSPGQRECRRIIGELLGAMDAAGLDFEATYAPHSLIPYLGQRISRAVGSASERGLLTRPSSGNTNARGSISITDAIIARLGSHSNRTVKEYTVGNRNDLRDIIAGAIANINERRAATS